MERPGHDGSGRADGVEVGVEEAQEGGRIASGLGEAKVTSGQVAVVEGEGELRFDGGALGGVEAGTEGVEATAEEKEERFESFESVFEFLGDLKMLRWSMQSEQAVVFVVQDVVQEGHFRAQALGESLAGERREGADGIDAPEVEEISGQWTRLRSATPWQAVFLSSRCYAVASSIQRGEREVGDGLNTVHCILYPELRFGVEGEARRELRTLNREESKVGSRGEGQVERKAEGRGFVEGLFDPVVRRGESERQGEQIEEESAGSGLFEVGAERGNVLAESGLLLAFEDGIGGEKRELGATCEGAGGGEAGSNAMAGGRVVDGEEERG